MSDNDGGAGLVWFLAGLGIGAIAGVLYAPRPGNETRDLVAERVGQGRDYVAQQSRQAADQASQFGRQVADQASQITDRGREVVRQKTDQISSVVKQQKDQISAAVDAGKQAYRDTTNPPNPGFGTPSSQV